MSYGQDTYGSKWEKANSNQLKNKKEFFSLEWVELK